MRSRTNFAFTTCLVLSMVKAVIPAHEGDVIDRIPIAFLERPRPTGRIRNADHVLGALDHVRQTFTANSVARSIALSIKNFCVSSCVWWIHCPPIPRQSRGK
jgi:hypothetical protein